MTLSGLTAGQVIPKALPIFIEGVKACDTVGDPTSMDQVFVVLEAVTCSGGNRCCKGSC